MAIFEETTPHLCTRN